MIWTRHFDWMGTSLHGLNSYEATFYEVRVRLATDFSSLAVVYIVQNPVREEIDSLQLESTSLE